MPVDDLLTSRTGKVCCMVGGALVVLGYFLPWVTYLITSGIYPRHSMWNGWRVATESGLVLMLPYLLPLCLGVLAFLSGASASVFVWLGAHQSAYRGAVVLGILVLAEMAYSISPLSLDSPPGTTMEVGPGVYVMAGATLLTIAGGVLMGLWRPGTARGAA